MRKQPPWWLRRICKSLYGLQKIIEAFTCNAEVIYEWKALASGGVTFRMRVRWWNPAAWVGWIRTVIFRDRQGCAYYRRRSDK